MFTKKRFVQILVLLLIAGCTTTPVSNRSALILVPFSQEVAMGHQAFDEILQKEKPSQDQELIAIVERVGRRIAAVTKMPDLDWEFKVIESDQQNAFALPGGKTAIYTGILPVCANEAGLAAVMGHEVAHVIARHGAQRMSQQILLTTGMTVAAVSMSNRRDHQLIMGALGLGVNYGVVLPFSRGMESESDEIGLIYMARAGYDPAEAERFWTRFAQMKTGPKPPEFMSTHPADTTRINDIRRLLPKARAIYQKNPNKYGLGVSFLVKMNEDKLTSPKARAPQTGPDGTASLSATPKTPTKQPRIMVRALRKKTPQKPATAPFQPSNGPVMHLDNQ